MSSAPRRRHSPAVYRRRRFVLLLAVLLVAAGVALAILRPWEGGASPAPAQSSGTSAPAATDSTTTSQAPTAPAAGASQGPAQPCTKDSVAVTARTDKQSYAAGENPQLSIVVKNTGAVDCLLDAGTAAQVFEVISGKDVYWRSADCQKDPTNQVVTLTAGKEVPSAQPLVWDRTRSSVETCDATDRAAAPAGGASYHLRVSVGGIASTETAQFMLN